MNRRQFLTASTLATSAVALRAAMPSGPHIATNVYPWTTFYRRAQRNWDNEIDSGLREVADAGLQGFEPIGSSPEQIRSLGPLLKRHELEMRSIYVNSTLHEATRAERSITEVLAIVQAAKQLGTQIVVTNPSPIRWGGPENKTDAQLQEQARNLDQLGRTLRQEGLTLAYHNHDAELREGAREFHHMLTATDPTNVKFCLDSHWIFRGCGNSQIALFDVLQHYHDRIVELHLRQSETGVWTEAFTMEGDIDYRRLFRALDSWSLKPHLVLEQAVEKGSPNTMNALEAHKVGRRNLLAAL